MNSLTLFVLSLNIQLLEIEVEQGRQGVYDQHHPRPIERVIADYVKDSDAVDPLEDRVSERNHFAARHLSDMFLTQQWASLLKGCGEQGSLIIQQALLLASPWPVTAARLAVLQARAACMSVAALLAPLSKGIEQPQWHDTAPEYCFDLMLSI